MAFQEFFLVVAHQTNGTDFFYVYAPLGPMNHLVVYIGAQIKPRHLEITISGERKKNKIEEPILIVPQNSNFPVNFF